MADVVEREVRRGGRVLVFGDFDCDGITATATLVRGLRRLGADVVGLIPHRYDEGYALSDAAIQRAMSYEPALIVTVDCGISCAEEVEKVRALGVEIVVTDHHEPGTSVPKGVPLADPKCHENCPSRDLAGVGVALKLVQMLGMRFGMPYLWCEYLDLACLGTVGDLMPLTGENRALVAAGLDILRNHPRPAVQAMLASCATAPEQLDCERLSFTLIPTINAAGRMGDATPAYELLLADDVAECERLAAKLAEVNTLRREVEAELAEQVEAAIAERGLADDAIVCVAGEGWHEGVKGIVASRVARKLQRPVIVLARVGDCLRGSGRSFGGINLFELLSNFEHLFEAFGGHEAACGVTIPIENFEKFRAGVNALYAERGAEMVAEPEACTWAQLSDCNVEGFEELNLLAPFGAGNHLPRLEMRGVFMANRSVVGKTGKHFRFQATNGAERIGAICFNAEPLEGLLECETVCDLIFEPSVDEWQGRKTAQLMVREISYSDSQYVEPEEQDEPEEAPADLSAVRAEWEQIEPALLTEKIKTALIGDHPMHAAQIETLERLEAGESVLTIMATGRGKSLIFHVHAARTAIKQHKASIFIYPLRALVNDQERHLVDTYSKFGCKVCVLNGETEGERREQVYAQLAAGELDVILTTPEFLHIHAGKFAQTGRIGFLVVDESHHIGLAKAGARPAYAALDEVVEALGRPQVLAVTATANTEVAADIKRVMGITRTIADPTVRANLHLDDRRDLRDRTSYLATLIARGEKVVAYVNSREQTLQLARQLRHHLPSHAPKIGFYNAGLPKRKRKQVEAAFRAGELMCIISTSAFGEGIDIPDIRHVVLFHLPFNDIEFNQMSGRAGRDGADATIHLLYGYADARINEGILKIAAPRREQLVALWRALKEAAQESQGAFVLEDKELAERANKLDRRARLEEGAVACGLAVFAELKFLRLEERAAAGTGERQRFIQMLAAPQKMELTDSLRYAEGLEELNAFNNFRQWALKTSHQELLERLNRPILPEGAEDER